MAGAEIGYNDARISAQAHAMITNPAVWNAWETEYIRSQRPDFARNLRIVEALYAEARALGALNRDARPDRLAHKIRLAQALNVPTTAGTDCR